MKQARWSELRSAEGLVLMEVVGNTRRPPDSVSCGAKAAAKRGNRTNWSKDCRFGDHTKGPSPHWKDAYAGHYLNLWWL